jgi:hypothetical protein
LVAFVNYGSSRSDIPVNRHNGLQASHFWLLDWEMEAIVVFAISHPREGYRRLAYMMSDADVVAVSPSSVYRVLKEARLLPCQPTKTSSIGFSFPGSRRLTPQMGCLY